MIEVTVSNADNAELLQGVMVTAVSEQKMQSTSVKTDANGKGYLRDLEKGHWTLYFEREGFVTNIAELRLGEGEMKSNSIGLKAKRTAGLKRRSSAEIELTVTNSDSSVLLRGSHHHRRQCAQWEKRRNHYGRLRQGPSA